MSKLPEFGRDEVERKSLLEREGCYTLEQYQAKIKAKYGFKPAVVGDKDRGCVSPLAGLAVPGRK
jgi:hypothetical protein